MALQLRPQCRKPLQNPCISRFFSSSSNGGEDDKTPPSSSYLSSIKASLRQSSQSPPRSGNPNSPPPFPPPRPSKIASLEEIRKNLSEFRRRSAAPPSPEGHDASSPPSISFQDLYKRNVIGQGNADASTDTKKLSLESIRESLRQLRASSPAAGIDPRRGQDDSRPSPLSLSALKESLKLKPTDVSGISSDSLRTSLFGRETGEAKTEADSQASRTEFVKMYSYGELGEKLKKLRPPEAESKKKKKKDWFSIEELNERLKKLREIEEKETESRIGGVSFKDLRDSLVKLKNATDASTKKQSSRLSL